MTRRKSSEKFLVVRWLFLLALGAGCTGGEGEPSITVRWEETFEGDVAPPGLGEERRVIVARTGFVGSFTTHEEVSGFLIEGPHTTVPTERAPIGIGGTAFLVSSSGAIMGFGFGDGMQKVNAQFCGCSNVPTPLARASDGSLRIGTSEDRLFGVQTDGTELFNVDGFFDAFDGKPAIAEDGTTYATLSGGRLIGMSTTGETVLDLPTGPLASAVATSGDRVMVGDAEGLKVFDRSGTELFTHPRQARVTGILMDGDRILVSGEDGLVELLDASGGILWSFSAGPPIYANAVLVTGGVAIYDNDGAVHYLDMGTGDRLATFDLGGTPKTEVVKGELGFVYAATGPRVVALAFSNGQ